MEDKINTVEGEWMKVSTADSDNFPASGRLLDRSSGLGLVNRK